MSTYGAEARGLQLQARATGEHEAAREEASSSQVGRGEIGGPQLANVAPHAIRAAPAIARGVTLVGRGLSVSGGVVGVVLGTAAAFIL